jgi:hypothetical protein
VGRLRSPPKFFRAEVCCLGAPLAVVLVLLPLLLLLLLLLPAAPALAESPKGTLL